MNQDNVQQGIVFFVYIYIVNKYYIYVLLILRDLMNLVFFDTLCSSSLFCISFAIISNIIKSTRYIQLINLIRV